VQNVMWVNVLFVYFYMTGVIYFAYVNSDVILEGLYL